MAELEHSKIISSVAGKILKPQGLVRKGQSRTWYDDQGFYTTIIEFQPHKYDHGAFLNVGVNFHWYAQDYESFDMGYRENGFEKFKTAEQFTEKIESMVQLALDKALNYREQLVTLETAKQNILRYTFTSDELWGNYHKGVICGLTSDKKGFNNYFDKLLSEENEDDIDWIDELKSKARELKEIVTDNSKFRSEIKDIIIESRNLKKMKTMEIGLI